MNAHWRNQLSITVSTPRDTLCVRESIDASADVTFAGLGVSADVVAALARRQITTPFAIQRLVLADALAGRDVLARSRTGSGKTLAFAVPIVETVGAVGQVSALVLVPTRELATQVAEEFRLIAPAKRLRVAAVYGGVNVAKQVREANRADILVATPGRLLDLLRRRLLRLNRVTVCVLDEADRMLDMGFLPDVSTILSVLPEKRQTMLFSATLDGDVRRLSDRFTRDPVRREITEERPVVSQAVHRFVAVNPQDKMDQLLRELAEERSLALVFVRTKRAAGRLARALESRGVPAQAMHGNLSQAARERALAHFSSGGADVMAATDVAARGLDLEHISHVVNFDPPADHTAYVHRVGRTARAGRGGTGVTFVTPDQEREVGLMARSLGLDREFVEAGLRPEQSGPHRPKRARPHRSGVRRR